jgi:hypothetical protein
MPADIIGNDLRQIIEFSSAFFKDGISPYTGYNYYPPFTTIFFAPLMFFSQYTSYVIISVITLIFYGFYLIFFSKKFSNRKKLNEIFLLFIITGFISYGFQFELERGQFNIIAIFLCVTAIYLFHFKPKYRILSYILFTFSVQLKLYPAIFIVMFVDDWNLWKDNFKRFLLIGFLNTSALFVLGWNIFIDFFKYVFIFSSTPVTWTGNHSISSFIVLITEKSVERLGMTWLSWTKELGSYAKLFILVVFLLTLLWLIYKTIKNKEKGFSKKLFFVCMVGALIIPPISHDYKLSLLVLPVALMFDEMNNKIVSPVSPVTKILIILSSFLYSSTIFSFSNKPVFFSNSFPFIFLLLFTLLAADYFIEKGQAKQLQ